jgi:hypothetical protein
MDRHRRNTVCSLARLEDARAVARGAGVKDCKYCGTKFAPVRPLAQVCSPICAIRLGKAKKADDRKELKARRERIKTIPQLIKEAQVAFNAFIRERDRDQACICCGRQQTNVDGLHAHGWDSGHYRSTGSASHLRFHEDNAHRQLVYCNRHGAGRAVDYRLGLIARIGVERVEALECSNDPHKWTRDELIAIRATYQAKTKQLLKEKA